jgi:uncharacterized protein
MILKYLLLVAVVVLAFYWWRHNRRADDATPPTPKAQPPKAIGPDAMVVCQHCGVHLPSRESTRGTLGTYCSGEHRRLAEGQ